MVFVFDVVNKVNNIVIPQNLNSFKSRQLVVRIVVLLSCFFYSWVPTIFKEVSTENWQIMNVPGMNMRSPKMMSGQSLSPYFSLSTLPTWMRHPQSWNRSYILEYLNWVFGYGPITRPQSELRYRTGLNPTIRAKN